MTTATAGLSLFTDPTESFEFRAFIFLDLIVARLKLRVLIELARLSFLGFYDRLEKSLDQLERAENEIIGEAEIKAIVEHRLHLASNIETLLGRLEPMTRMQFKNSTVGDYVAGKDRIETLRAIIKSAKIEHRAEELIENSKIEFLSEFARRKLTKHQRDQLVERHRRLSVHQ
jgi:hypothetical protein